MYNVMHLFIRNTHLNFYELKLTFVFSTETYRTTKKGAKDCRRSNVHGRE